YDVICFGVCRADPAIAIDVRGFDMSDPTDRERVELAVQRLGIGQYRRHVLLCTGPKCCTEEVGAAAWDELKKQLADKGLSAPGAANGCYRTRVNCLRVCAGGPTMVVYPEGTWYHGVTADRMTRLIDQHLINNQPVPEWAFAENPLPK